MLRASVVSVRCGRSLPLMHLSELDEVFPHRRLHRAPIVLCGADVADPDHDDDGHGCPGCADCLRYCPDCVRSAVRWAEQRNGINPNAEGDTDEASDA